MGGRRTGTGFRSRSTEEASAAPLSGTSAGAKTGKGQHIASPTPSARRRATRTRSACRRRGRSTSRWSISRLGGGAVVGLSRIEAQSQTFIPRRNFLSAPAISVEPIGSRFFLYNLSIPPQLAHNFFPTLARGHTTKKSMFFQPRLEEHRAC